MKRKWQIKKSTLLLLCILLYGSYSNAMGSSRISPRLIAHSAGSVNQQTYTNSLEALETNYNKGFKFFEVDFSWTSDHELVAIHDWGKHFRETYIVPGGGKIPSETEFLKLKMKNGLTPISIDDVLHWAKQKGDVFIVTDIKKDVNQALEKIHTEHQAFKRYLIPQVYSYQQYEKAKQLGYENVILTLYRMRIDPNQVLDFALKEDPFAVTMHWKIAQAGLARYLSVNNIIVYAHTVNDPSLFESLRSLGVYGIYTDHITPNSFIENKQTQ